MPLGSSRPCAPICFPALKIIPPFQSSPQTTGSTGWSALRGRNSKDIVLRPAAAARLKLAGTSPAGLPFEEVLVEAAANAPDCLPLLQSVLARLYEREGGSGAISYSAYAALGELEGAVGNRAEEIVAPLLDSEAMHNALCQVILALGRLDADTGTVVARTVRLDPASQHRTGKG